MLIETFEPILKFAANRKEVNPPLVLVQRLLNGLGVEMLRSTELYPSINLVFSLFESKYLSIQEKGRYFAV